MTALWFRSGFVIVLYRQPSAPSDSNMLLQQGKQRQGNSFKLRQPNPALDSILQNETWCNFDVFLRCFVRVGISLWSASTMLPGYSKEYWLYWASLSTMSPMILLVCVNMFLWSKYLSFVSSYCFQASRSSNSKFPFLCWWSNQMLLVTLYAPASASTRNSWQPFQHHPTLHWNYLSLQSNAQFSH